MELLLLVRIRAEEIGKELDEFNRVFEEVASNLMLISMISLQFPERPPMNPSLLQRMTCIQVGKCIASGLIYFHEEVMQKVAVKN